MFAPMVSTLERFHRITIRNPQKRLQVSSQIHHQCCYGLCGTQSHDFRFSTAHLVFYHFQSPLKFSRQVNSVSNTDLKQLYKNSLTISNKQKQIYIIIFLIIERERESVSQSHDTIVSSHFTIYFCFFFVTRCI